MWPLEGDRLATTILATGRPAREDDWATPPARSRCSSARSSECAPRSAARSSSRERCGARSSSTRADAPPPGRHRGPAGEVHRAGRDGDLEHPGAGRGASPRGRAGRAAAGGDARGARGVPSEVFAAVAEELGRLLEADAARLVRYDERRDGHGGGELGPTTMPSPSAPGCPLGAGTSSAWCAERPAGPRSTTTRGGRRDPAYAASWRRAPRSAARSSSRGASGERWSPPRGRPMRCRSARRRGSRRSPS